MKNLLFFIFWSLTVVSVQARIINIPADYSTIQAGIDASISGDTVLVAPGEYIGNLNFNGRNIVLSSSNGPDTTLIRGYIAFNHNEDTTCIFRGFQVIGQGRDPRQDALPSILVASGEPQIVGNIIKGNVSMGYGGGIGIQNSNAIIRHNIIENNWNWVWGGGIFAWARDKIEISYNIVRNNRSGFFENSVGMGAGIWCKGGDIFYNLIYDNTVRSAGPEHSLCGQGGGIFLDLGGRHLQVYNNTIVQDTALNRPWGDGGGIYVTGTPADSNDNYIKNNIIAYNNRGGIFIPGGITATYNLLYGNSSYDIISPETSITNVFADPMFIDTLNNDFHLDQFSPCIDAGDPESLPDPDSTRADIGALYFDHSTKIDDENSYTEPQIFRLQQNYPNPFNSQTKIYYNLQFPAKVSLTIYDITGRNVKEIVKNEQQERSFQQYVWDGNDSGGKPMPTAIYFYELVVANQKYVKSMILIR